MTRRLIHFEDVASDLPRTKAERIMHRAASDIIEDYRHALERLLNAEPERAGGLIMAFGETLAANLLAATIMTALPDATAAADVVAARKEARDEMFRSLLARTTARTLRILNLNREQPKDPAP